MGEDCIAELTLEEKTLLTCGDGEWHTHKVGNLPAVMMTDGPHGLRKQSDSSKGINDSNPATCFPTACAVASSWNVDNAAKIAQCIADEAIAEDVSVVLGPGINIKRSPLCGRNFEYFSEDPLLAGKMGTAYVQAMQQKGVGCCLKHFAVNSRESRRMTVDALVDERALREIYLAAFEQVVKNARPWCVMASYNKINGVSSTQNKRLLTDILRNEWNFDGVVMSDWGASYDTAQAIAAGMDLEMPEDKFGYHRRKVAQAVNGSLSEEALNTACHRVATLVKRCCVEKTSDKNLAKHHQVCRQVAADSAVLLKNSGVLPLAPHEDFCVVGELAEKPRFQGAGSSHINAQCKNFLQVLSDNGISALYEPGYDVTDDKSNKKAVQKAVELAKKHKYVLFFGGLTDIYEGEGYDRTHLAIPQNQQELLEQIFRVNPHVVFVAFGGSPFEMPWIGKVSALLNMYLGGQAVMEAAFDLLFGRVSPGGRVAETFPLQLADTPCYNYFDNDRYLDEHRESLFVGYRYYNTFEKPVLFPFGYGLTYSEFAYSAFSVQKVQCVFDVSVTVQNVGKVAAAEVVQLYVDNCHTDKFLRAKRELRSFTKVYLQPQQSETVHFRLSARDFSLFVPNKGFVAANGIYGISLCKNVEEPLQTATVTVDFGEDIAPFGAQPAYYVASTEPFAVADEQFYHLTGVVKPVVQQPKRGQFTLLNTFEDLAEKVRLVRFLTKIIRKLSVKISGSKSFREPAAQMTYYGAMETPLISLMSVGKIPAKYVKFLLYHSNKQRGKAFKALFGKYQID